MSAEHYEVLCAELAGHISRITGQTIDFATPLLGEGIIDSFNVLEIVQFLEERTGMRINPAEITMEHFASVDALAAWVAGLSGSEQT